MFNPPRRGDAAGLARPDGFELGLRAIRAGHGFSGRPGRPFFFAKFVPPFGVDFANPFLLCSDQSRASAPQGAGFLIRRA
jgi:hypothetical protein